MSSEIAISVNNVSKCYEMYAQPRDRLLQFLSMGRKKFYKEFWALRNISFDIKKGETVGILGRNGSGKSTLLQIIAGTLTPTTGDIQTSGTLAALLELGSGFNPEFSGRENIFLNGAILGLSREQMQEKYEEIVAFADIGEHIDQPVKTYSSGMAVRLAFAVQACVSPHVLIVDEALSVGDEKFQRKCFDYIERLRSNGCSILLVTHSTSTVEKFCQRGVLLHKGEMHGIGAAKEIVDQYHALLYSDEKAYLKYQKTLLKATENVVVESVGSNAFLPDEVNHAPTESDAPCLARALIKGWDVLDENGEVCEQFKAGEKVFISIFVDALMSVDEMQAGLLIRTVEGVSVFGTSTLYHGKNCVNVAAGDSLRFDFEVALDLCEGTYFVTLAIAEAVSSSDMAYLDRKTDVIVIRIFQPRVLASGIAFLDAKVNVERIGVVS